MRDIKSLVFYIAVICGVSYYGIDNYILDQRRSIERDINQISNQVISLNNANIQVFELIKSASDPTIDPVHIDIFKEKGTHIGNLSNWIGKVQSEVNTSRDEFSRIDYYNDAEGIVLREELNAIFLKYSELSLSYDRIIYKLQQSKVTTPELHRSIVEELYSAYAKFADVTVNYNEAVLLSTPWHKAEEFGEALDQYKLAERYYHGWGFIRDYEQAYYWYSKAAEQDFSWAQEALEERDFPNVEVAEIESELTFEQKLVLGLDELAYENDYKMFCASKPVDQLETVIIFGGEGRQIAPKENDFPLYYEDTQTIVNNAKLYEGEGYLGLEIVKSKLSIINHGYLTCKLNYKTERQEDLVLAEIFEYTFDDNNAVIGIRIGIRYSWTNGVLDSRDIVDTSANKMFED